jgi:putative restriction endonuclease
MSRLGRLCTVGWFAVRALPAWHYSIMHAYVGVTDGDWYRYLGAIGANEVNFWRPGGGNAFHRIRVGEPFFFKSHYRDGNRIVGGGFYSGFAALRISEAWQFFGQANGAASLAQMRERVGRYRKAQLAPDDDPVIGCLFVRDVAFFDSVDYPPPRSWAPNIVQGAGFDMDDPAERPYFDVLMARMLGTPVHVASDAAWHRPGPTFGDPRLVPQRLGQRAFQGVVLNAYHGRCAVTGDKIRLVLQAAHIRPVTQGGEHRLDNGLLLRSDVHTLFDRGYLAVDPKHRLLVSPRLRAEFGNGEEFYALSDSREPISVPLRKADRPNAEFLEWHLDEVFLAS